ncbi:MAG: flagellar hook-associated protein FlgK [Lachnospiraceae bacterium]|nr:flagellar hook-associated protein FlgK [Lachnospiraceae bacterium]
MANGFGSLYVGRSGLQGAQNAINVTANNLSNLNTQGYVREQVIFTDTQYSTLSPAKVNYVTDQSINMKQSGLGVQIGDVVHNRDIFLDQYYRSEVGRRTFYETSYGTTREIEELLQETEGEAFQEVLADLNEAIQELAKDPGTSINQNLVVQKATLFIERSVALYDSLKEYQLNLNTQIEDKIKRINEIGKELVELNEIVRTVEAGHVETAMEVRDRRDNLLDELGSLGKITYKEREDGVVTVRFEGVEFVDKFACHEITTREDTITGFKTPVWKDLSDLDKEEWVDVYDFNVDISTELNTDIGELKAIVMCRGTEYADFLDIEGKSAKEFSDTTQLSPLEAAEAQLDHLVHTLVTTLNNLFSPLKEETITVNGRQITCQVWNEENGTVGANGKGPGTELFSRRSYDRYKEVKDDNGKIWYVYNEEDTGEQKYDDNGKAIPRDTATYYNMVNLIINKDLVADETLLPTFRQNGEIDHSLSDKLANIFDKELTELTPDAPLLSFKNYYDNMVGYTANAGSVFSSVSNTLSSSVASIDHQRSAVINVSSDEELSNMIRFQSAYNAASRFITTIDEMIEHMIMQLGR